MIRHRGFLALVSVQFMSSVGFAVAQPFIPLYIQELGIVGVRDAAVWSGTLGLVGSLAMAVASPIWGALADRFGKKLMLNRAIFSGAVIQSAMGIAGDMYQLVALRGLQGFTTGVYSAAMALAAAIVPTSSLGFALGALQTAVSLGMMLGPFLGGWLAVAVGFRAVFFVTGAMLLLSGIVSQLTLQETSKTQKRARHGRNLWSDVVAALRVESVPSLLLVIVISRAANFSMIITVPIVLQEISGGGLNVSGQAGTVLGLSALALAIGSLLWGRLSDRLGQAKVLAMCLALSALVIVPQALAHSFLNLVFGQVLFSLALAGLMPAASAIMGTISRREQQGAVFGISGTALSVGNGVGSGMAAVVIGILGTPAMFICIGLCILIVLFHMLPELSRLDRKREMSVGL